MNYYVLSCETGREEKNIKLLEHTVERLLPGSYLKAYSPVRESREFCAKTWSMKLRPILPGYIIAVSDSELWRIQKEIFMMSATCYGFLRNPDRSYELRGTDEAFARWIEENNGLVKATQVILDENGLTPNDRIKILSGPMKNFEGRILSIYKGVRVQAEVVFLGQVKKITLPIDVVERIAKTEETENDSEAVREEEKNWFVTKTDY